MRERARAVVIGGGVGGCAILYWLARLGWDDVVLVERAELTSGSTFHSAGLVGQLRSSLSLTKMMMESVQLYRSLEEEVGLETGWREVGSLRLASSQERMEEIARQAGWAKTFGLPLELISPKEAQELFPPLSTDGVLGAAFLPTDGYVDPSQLTLALAEGARRRGAGIEQRTRVVGITYPPRPRRRRGDRPRPDRDRRRRQCGRHVRGRDRGARRRQRPDRPDGARVPDHQACGTSARDADDARSHAPRVLPARVGRAGHGRVRAQLCALGSRRHSFRLQLEAPRGGLAPLRGADGERRHARSVPQRHGGRQAHQRAGGLHSGRRVHPRPDRRSRLLGRRRILRARAGRRGRDGEARRGVDRRRHALARRLAHGLSPLRRLLPQPRLHGRTHEGDLRDVLRRQVPGARAPGRTPAARLTRVRAAARAWRGVRRKVRLGARELVRAERGACRRDAPAQGLGGKALVGGDRRRAPRVS